MGGVIWHGGVGHRIIGIDDGIECFRCGLAADAGVDEDPRLQGLIPDCRGPEAIGHHWVAAARGIECAYGDAWVRPDASSGTGVACRRA